MIEEKVTDNSDCREGELKEIGVWKQNERNDEAINEMGDLNKNISHLINLGFT